MDHINLNLIIFNKFSSIYVLSHYPPIIPSSPSPPNTDWRTERKQQLTHVGVELAWEGLRQWLCFLKEDLFHVW